MITDGKYASLRTKHVAEEFQLELEFWGDQVRHVSMQFQPSFHLNAKTENHTFPLMQIMEILSTCCLHMVNLLFAFHV